MTWHTITVRVLNRPCHEEIKVEKWLVPHPRHAGFKLGNGDPNGQLADYRKSLSKGRSLHIQEYDDHYKVHWDQADPSKDPLMHLLIDAPHWAIILGIVGLGIYYLAKD